MGRKSVSIESKNIILLGDIGISQHEISLRCIRQTIREFDCFHNVATKSGAEHPQKVTDREKKTNKTPTTSRRKPRITLSQKRHRLRWCYEHLNWLVKELVFQMKVTMKYLIERTDRLGNDRTRFERRVHKGGGIGVCSSITWDRWSSSMYVSIRLNT